MTDMLTAAAYIADRYQKESGQQIDEMKLHKLLYFAQRECLIQTDSPMFPEEFQGWRLGPVAPPVRSAMVQGTFPKAVDPAALAPYRAVLDYVFANYAQKDSWSLSRLTHGETCWKISRKGIAPAESSNVPIPTDDIRLDADRIRQRRAMLKEQGLL